MNSTPIQTVSVIGLGTIGMRWTATFVHAGLQVRAQDPDPQAWTRYQALEPQLLAELDRLHPGATKRQPAQFSTSVSDACAHTDFVQENAPEELEIKRTLMAALDACTPAHAIIASSSSALRVSDFQKGCAGASRIVLGHPFNPVHLMPLVEVAAGDATTDDTVQRAMTFYEQIGKKPVVLRRELVGHLALRLMGAMWREAIALVAEGSVSVRDIDRAFQYGPGPKWTLQGSFVSNHLGADGLADFLDKYGQTYLDIWKDLRATPDLDDPATREAIIRGTDDAIGMRTPPELQQQRDAGLIEILRTQKQFITDGS